MSSKVKPRQLGGCAKVGCSGYLSKKIKRCKECVKKEAMSSSAQVKYIEV